MDGTLGRLATDLGERSTYDAASQCSRCGYCEQSCPTYKATGDEKKSPRGRNQLVRLMLEGKLADRAAAEEALSTCLLCSACTTTCYAHVPTADIVLEGRRLLARPKIALLLSRLLLDHPKLFAAGLKFAFLAKRLGLSALARPLLRLAGLGGLAEADAHTPEAPLRFSHEVLTSGADSSQRLQFQPCGTRYVFPRVAVATQKALGGTRPFESGCCGLLAYNYGALDDAREAARRVIVAAEKDAGEIVVDCSSCAAYMKQYEQLFLHDAQWRDRARAFVARVRDVLQVLPTKPATIDATYHESCRACHGQGLKAPALAKDFTQLAESDQCCGGAGAFSLLHPELSDEILKRKVSNIAKTRAKVVATSSTSCLLQLAHGLRKYYPSCEVRHVSEIAAFLDGETRK